MGGREFRKAAQSCRDQRGDARQSDIVQVVRGARKRKKIHVEKAEDGQETDHQVTKAEEYRPTPTLSETPEHSKNRQPQQPRYVSNHRAGNYWPARIDHAQLYRNQRFVEIEPQRPGAAQQPRKARVSL